MSGSLGPASPRQIVQRLGSVRNIMRNNLTIPPTLRATPRPVVSHQSRPFITLNEQSIPVNLRPTVVDWRPKGRLKVNATKLAETISHRSPSVIPQGKIRLSLDEGAKYIEVLLRGFRVPVPR
jgi:hypothetical protein